MFVAVSLQTNACLRVSCTTTSPPLPRVVISSVSIVLAARRVALLTCCCGRSLPACQQTLCYRVGWLAGCLCFPTHTDTLFTCVFLSMYGVLCEIFGQGGGRCWVLCVFASLFFRLVVCLVDAATLHCTCVSLFPCSKVCLQREQ